MQVDPSRAVRVWASLAEDEPGDVIGYVAHVIGLGADRLKLADKERLREDLSTKLREYRCVFWFEGSVDGVLIFLTGI